MRELVRFLHHAVENILNWNTWCTGWFKMCKCGLINKVSSIFTELTTCLFV